MQQNFADILLLSDYIFTGLTEYPEKGYIAIIGNKIAKLGRDDNFKAFVGHNTKVVELKEQLILPGFVDVHTFFTGYAIYHIGTDMEDAYTKEECMKRIRVYEKSLPIENSILGHGWQPEQFSKEENNALKKMLDEVYQERAVILFAADRSTCMMNDAARKAYGFTPEECYPEAYYKIMREYLNDRIFIDAQFTSYMQMMNKRGVTSVKEMGFDDFYGFDEYLKEKEEKNELTLRVFFMSQPVGEGINIKHGKRMMEKFTGDFVRFSGYNRMTDGTVASGRGDLLMPYEGTDSRCGMDIDYDMIKKEVLLADENGFRYSLHAQGDGAVHKVLDIYNKCKKQDGKVINRHTITDMEFTNPKDLERMGELGIIGEIYFQIMSLDAGDEVKAAIKKTIGTKRGQYYWNRRKMLDSGVTLSGATDLPLMFTDIPEAIYHSCGGYFPEGGEPFNKQNTISIAEILKAWTYGGQKNLFAEDVRGTLEAGKIADITVLDRNVFNVEMKRMRDVKVAMTIVDGQIVYEGF